MENANDKSRLTAAKQIYIKIDGLCIVKWMKDCFNWCKNINKTYYKLIGLTAMFLRNFLRRSNEKDENETERI